MVNKYKCLRCGAVSKEREWDEETAREYGIDVDEIMGINEGGKDDELGCSFVCPNCGEELFPSDIQEV